jgi:hypothetical protein
MRLILVISLSLLASCGTPDELLVLRGLNDEIRACETINEQPCYIAVIPKSQVEKLKYIYWDVSYE